MAAKTPVSATAGLALASDFQAYKHERYRFTDIDNSDTWTPGGDFMAGVVSCAFESDGASDIAGVFILNGAFVFGTPTQSDVSGYLHVWRRR